LCEEFDLTRWLSGTAPPDVISLERLGLIVATSGLESAESEAAEIRQLLGDKVEDVSPSGDAVYQLLKTGGFSGLHFACHGEYNAKEPDWSNLYLTEGATLCPIDVDGEKLVFGKVRPFVFLNACETGQGGYALTGMGGWAEAFVRRASSSGFVGSIWQAHDESAYKFAVTFYRNLLEGKTVAEAARLARRSIKRAGDPTWLSYTVYANPLARLAIETSYTVYLELSGPEN
jgi:CHAT domain-containing protein